MKINDIINEDASAGATSSGSVATVAVPLGGVIARNPQSLFYGKYTNEPTPNTPAAKKTQKRKK